MSHMREIGPLVYGKDYKAIISYMQRKHLCSRMNCSICGSPMEFKTRTQRKGSLDGYTWRCTDSHCRTMKTIRSGSFFEKSKVSLDKWLLLIHHWAVDSKVSVAAAAVGVSRVTVMQCNQFLREVCSQKLLQSPIILGGTGRIVQVDESLFSHSVKGHRGCPPNQQVWVFGIVDVSVQPALGYMQIVDRRDSATLLPIISNVVAAGSIVHSDEWS